MSTNNTQTTNTMNTNTAIMSHKEFDDFVKTTVSSFLSHYNLGKISVDVGNGYKGKVKINKNGEIEAEVTFKEII